MLLVFLSWCWIGFSAFLWGFAGLHIMAAFTGYTQKKPDFVILLGICLLTVYAQSFSLFYKVGELATIFLLAFDLIILVLLKKEIWSYVNSWLICAKKKYWLAGLWLLVVCLLGVMLLALSSDRPLHYDTDLYHAQSIRWIEEYGIVPGLGNLHNRLAYNSSLFSLQALFSMRYLAGQSLHSINGFVALVLLSYSIFSIKAFRYRKIFPSDFLRLSFFILYNYSHGYVLLSSPGSDYLALGLVCYILVKWVSCLEDGEKGSAAYAYLSLLAVFALTVKLSALMIVLLAVVPAVKLFQNKKWKAVVTYIVTGVLIIAPFLIRNVIISGYLLYPYEAIDFFSVDWKMPAFTLAFDRNEIKAWGWGLNDVLLYDTPLKEWFPVWFSMLSTYMRMLFWGNGIAVICGLAEGLRRGFKGKDWNFLWVVVVIIANFILWFAGSPSVRYGGIYMAFLPLLVLGMAAEAFYLPPKGTLAVMRFSVVVVVTICMWPMIKWTFGTEWNYIKRCADYDRRDCTEYSLGGENIYVPTQGDQAGYEAFPSTPYAARLDKIELRGESLEDGFRMREEYREAYVSTYGQVYEENIFE